MSQINQPSQTQFIQAQQSVPTQQLVVETPEGTALRQTQQAAGSNPFDGLTLPQALNWVDANVTDLASARTALKHLTKLVFVLRADSKRNSR